MSGRICGLLGILIIAACSGGAPTGQASPSPAASPTPGLAATANPAPGPTNVGSFDPVHAASVLSPSVGLVIATTASGVSEGSAFVYGAQSGASLLLTNNHVVSGASRVQLVMPDGRHFTASVPATDAIEDVAVLKVSGSLPAAQFADSTRLQVGTPVVAIGSPQGSQGFGSVTTGVISALHRSLSNVAGARGATTESLGDVLQTDAPINLGNSGGPLGDGNGRVVGMNTASSTGAQGIGYAIPSAILLRVAPVLAQGRTPGHPYLGLCSQPIESALESDPSLQGYGVVVTRALPGTPSEKAGLQVGDVIERVDATDLRDGSTLGGVLALHNPGDTVSLMVLRSGNQVTLSATLTDRPANGGQAC